MSVVPPRTPLPNDHKSETLIQDQIDMQYLDFAAGRRQIRNIVKRAGVRYHRETLKQLKHKFWRTTGKLSFSVCNF